MKTEKSKSIIYTQANISRRLIIAGLSILVLGILYYLVLRPLPVGMSWLIQQFNLKLDFFPLLNNYSAPGWSYSAPSALHVLAFSFLSLSLVTVTSRNIYIIGVAWLLVSAAFEISQYFINIGTFDWFDLFAAVVASASFIIIASRLKIRRNVNTPYINSRPTIYSSKSLYLLPLLVFGMVAITGSYPPCESSATDGQRQTDSCYGTPSNTAEPVYMSYEELRSSAIFTDPNRPLKETGKIYLYNDFLFISSPNEGVHIYNNVDPQFPIKIGFINVPGNVDIAISQDYLYVDSYIDLVTIDIADIQAPLVTNRQLNVFPYDPYQNIPDYIRFNNVDPSKGVVVGYKLL